MAGGHVPFVEVTAHGVTLAGLCSLTGLEVIRGRQHVCVLAPSVLLTSIHFSD